MAESDDAQVQRTSLLGLVRNIVTLVLTLIPILLSGLRIFAVANGDRPTLVTLLSTLCESSATRYVRLAAAHRVWGRGGDFLDSMAPAAISVWATQRRQSTALLWLAVGITIVAVILFALAPVNDLFNLSSARSRCTSFASPSETG